MQYWLNISVLYLLFLVGIFIFYQHALPVNSILLGIKKEHGTFQICSSKKNIIEGFESFKGYSLSCVTFFLYSLNL